MADLDLCYQAFCITILITDVYSGHWLWRWQFLAVTSYARQCIRTFGQSTVFETHCKISACTEAHFVVLLLGISPDRVLALRLHYFR